MNSEYWLERWKEGEIGFHQAGINPYLCQFWPQLRLPQKSTIAVPLCGKSRDMLWLQEQHHSVLGIELSPIAVQAFFEENGLYPYHTVDGKFDRMTAGEINILRGDFFDLSTEHFSTVNAVYDRAALVAFPPNMRTRYVDHLLKILPAPAQILLVTLDYPPNEMSGPPFAISSDEVQSLYQPCATLQLLTSLDILDQNQRFKERSLSQLHESVFLIKTA